MSVCYSPLRGERDPLTARPGDLGHRVSGPSLRYSWLPKARASLSRRAAQEAGWCRARIIRCAADCRTPRRRASASSQRAPPPDSGTRSDRVDPSGPTGPFFCAPRQSGDYLTFADAPDKNATGRSRYESTRHTFILAHYVTPLKWGWVHSINLGHKETAPAGPVTPSADVHTGSPSSVRLVLLAQRRPHCDPGATPVTQFMGVNLLGPRVVCPAGHLDLGLETAPRHLRDVKRDGLQHHRTGPAQVQFAK